MNEQLKRCQVVDCGCLAQYQAWDKAKEQEVSVCLYHLLTAMQNTEEARQREPKGTQPLAGGKA